MCLATGFAELSSIDFIGEMLYQLLQVIDHGGFTPPNLG